MSTTAEILQLIESLLDKDWTDEEKVLLKKLSDNLIYYKKLIPNTLKGDIIAILKIANNIKSDYENIKLRLSHLEGQEIDKKTEGRMESLLENIVESIEHSLEN
jgi:hypothetical protein